MFIINQFLSDRNGQNQLGCEFGITEDTNDQNKDSNLITRFYGEFHQFSFQLPMDILKTKTFAK